MDRFWLSPWLDLALFVIERAALLALLVLAVLALYKLTEAAA